MSKAPEATFRYGNVSSSVFVNESESNGQKRKFRSVNVQRSYRDGDDTKFTSSFSLGDLPAAIAAMQMAQRHVEDKEAEVTG